MSNVGQGGYPPITQDTGEPGGPYFETTGAGNGTSTLGGSSTTDTAKEQAGQVAQDAKESGKQVAATAADESKQVLAEGRRQVKDLTAQAGQQVDEQTRVHDVAGWLESRNPGEIVDELRGIARRRPGAFLLSAAAAGVVAGRLTRGAVDAARSDDDSTPTAAGQAPVASYGVPATSGGPDVDLTSVPVTTPVETTTGRELYAETDDPLYSGTSLGGNR